MCQALCWLPGRSHLSILERSWGPAAAGRENRHQTPSFPASIYIPYLHKTYRSFGDRDEREKSCSGFVADHCHSFCGCPPSIHFFPLWLIQDNHLDSSHRAVISSAVTTWPNPADERWGPVCSGGRGGQGTGKGDLAFREETWVETMSFFFESLSWSPEMVHPFCSHKDTTQRRKLYGFARVAGT